VDLLQKSLSHDRLSHAYLIAGAPSVGKTSLALYLARALNCLSAGPRPCGACAACRKIGQGVHPDVRVIDGLESGGKGDGSRETRAAESTESSSRRRPGIKIGQVREMQAQASLSPFEGSRHWRSRLPTWYSS
jgi:DNA polymerase-3 subunit delta'